MGDQQFSFIVSDSYNTITSLRQNIGTEVGRKYLPIRIGFVRVLPQVETRKL